MKYKVAVQGFLLGLLAGIVTAVLTGSFATWVAVGLAIGILLAVGRIRRGRGRASQRPQVSAVVASASTGGDRCPAR